MSSGVIALLVILVLASLGLLIWMASGSRTHLSQIRSMEMDLAIMSNGRTLKKRKPWVQPVLTVGIVLAVLCAVAVATQLL